MIRYEKKDRIIDYLHLINVKVQYKLAAIFHDYDWKYFLDNDVESKRNQLSFIMESYREKLEYYILCDYAMPKFRKQYYENLAMEYSMLRKTVRDYKRFVLYL